jgi:hypothetical protein
VNPRQEKERAMDKDTQVGLRRVKAVLNKLDQHETNVSISDDPDEVTAVRFALLDAAKEEVASMLDQHHVARADRAPAADPGSERERTRARAPGDRAVGR